jgi:hypothetical protein
MGDRRRLSLLSRLDSENVAIGYAKKMMQDQIIVPADSTMSEVFASFKVLSFHQYPQFRNDDSLFYFNSGLTLHLIALL